MNTEIKAGGGTKWNVLTEEVRQSGKLQRRRYVRLDIASPVELKLIVPASAESQEPGFIPFTGEILNVSAGGLLVESREAIPEGDYVVIELELNGTDKLSGVVGKIKRCDSESESAHLIGVEFCTEEDIRRNCPEEYQKLLGECCTSFSEKVRALISKYVFSRTIQKRSEGET